MCLLSNGTGRSTRCSMRTIVIAGGTRGIGGALAARLRQTGDRVIAIGSADADLTSARQTTDLVGRLPDRIDALVFAAGRFSPGRVITAEGLEQTFAIGVLSRYILAEGLRPTLDRADRPVVLNLCGTDGIRSRHPIAWDDLQLTRGYSLLRAVLQGARANDLLGVGFTHQDPDSRIRYVLYNPLFVDSGMHRQFRQPLRTLIGAAAGLLGSSVDRAADRLLPILADPPAAPLTALRRTRPVNLDRPEFNPTDAARLYEVLSTLTSR
jgi:NAD(P)-dependent dehydrogenase (short-subunit alcohol dehydrogenase family)